MIRDYLSKIDGVSIYPEIALILFFVMFAAAIIWVFRLDKKYISRMENIPFDSTNNNETNSEIENEGNK